MRTSTKGWFPDYLLLPGSSQFGKVCSVCCPARPPRVDHDGSTSGHSPSSCVYAAGRTVRTQTSTFCSQSPGCWWVRGGSKPCICGAGVRGSFSMSCEKKLDLSLASVPLNLPEPLIPPTIDEGDMIYTCMCHKNLKMLQ